MLYCDVPFVLEVNNAWFVYNGNTASYSKLRRQIVYKSFVLSWYVNIYIFKSYVIVNFTHLEQLLTTIFLRAHMMLMLLALWKWLWRLKIVEHLMSSTMVLKSTLETACLLFLSTQEVTFSGWYYFELL